MKHTQLSLIVVLLLGCLAASTPAQAEIKFGFRVLGGGAYLPAGDLNATRGGFDMDGHMSRIRLGADLTAELVLSLSPSFGLTVGSGFISATRTSELRLSENMDRLDTSARAIPLRIGVYYIFSSRGPWDLSIQGDVGYFLSHWEETWAWSFSDQDQIYSGSTVQEADSNGIGLQGSLAVAYRISPRFALVGEVFGRWADLKGFEGNAVYTASGYREELNGKLYYYDWEDEGKLYPWIEILDRVPREIWDDIANDREAVISFSGFGVRLGFKFAL
jgi:hypothetical protein